jgi:hypothetical protein
MHKRLNIHGYPITCIASNFRKPDFDWSKTKLISGIGEEGDVVLLKVLQDEGSTIRVENYYGRDVRIYSGDYFIGILGNRHTGTSEYGEIPKQLLIAKLKILK